MESLKLNHKFRDIHQLRENIKRPHCNQITINLSENAHKKIDCTKKYYSKINLVNNLPKNPDRLTELLRYYSKNLRLCSNLRELYIQQIVLSDQNLKYLTRLIKFLKHIQVLSLDIRLSDVLSLPVVNKFYRAIYRLKHISGLKIFTSTFYRYPHNILRPLFLRPDLQARLRNAEFTITRELSENQKETFLARLQQFKRIQDLSLDFSRASTANTLPYILGGFDAFKHLESLSMNLNGQYMPTDAYKNLALSLESLNLQKLTMTFKCTSTIGYDLYKVLKAVNRKLNYLKLTFVDEHNLSSDALAPLEDAFKSLGRLNEFYLDVSQSQFCNLILNKIAFAFSKLSAMKKIFIKYNSNDTGFKYRGVAMQNIKELLKGNPYLKDIELHCMDSRGVKDHIMPLIEGIKALKSLEYLNIYFHYIPMSDFSFKGLIQAIEDNKKNLKGLNLKIDSYRLTDHSLEILAGSLKKLQCLEEFTLTIMKWKISEKGLRPLSSVLMNLRKLFRIEVKFIEAGSEQIAQNFELGLKKGLSKHRLCVEYCK